MLKIEDKALNYAKKKGGCFVVYTQAVSGGCCEMAVKSISVELKNTEKPENTYTSFEYEGVKVFIEKGLKLEENIKIYSKISLPLIGMLFGVKGASIKYL